MQCIVKICLIQCSFCFPTCLLSCFCVRNKQFSALVNGLNACLSVANLIPNSCRPFSKTI